MEEMKKRGLTDEEVEKEIERLQQSPYVALSRKEQRIKYKRRQTLYTLRQLDKRGRELAEAGITLDTLESYYDELDSIC